ncbi:MAG: amidohydrolase family protein, partial [bacterium]
MSLLRDLLLLWTGSEELAGVDVLIDGGRVKAIGKNLDPRGPDAKRPDLAAGALDVIDCSGLVVVPGLVNTHHHFYQTLQRCVRDIQGAELFPWLKRLYQIWKHLDDDAVYWSTLVACGELLKTGCTTSSDNLYVFPRGKSSRFIDVEIEAASKMGMRFHPTRGSMSRGEAQGGLPPDVVVQTEQEIIEDCDRLISLHHDPAPGAMVRIALAPCSPISVSEEILVETARFARERGVLIHTHLAETEDET